MNTFNHTQASAETLQTRFGLRLAAALDEHAASGLSADIQTRLRFAREQALARAKVTQVQTSAEPAVVSHSGSTATLGGGRGNWWTRLGVLLPLVVLVLGLLWIDRQHTRAQIEAAAQVDADLLADDLPPEAYRDPGFAEFLKNRP
jgi:hypothetical protein